METAPIGGAPIFRGWGRCSRPATPHSAQRRLSARALACWLVYVLLWKTRWGYEIRATGQNPAAAEYGGISIRKEIVLTMAISGRLRAWSASTRCSATAIGITTVFPTTTALPESPVALLGRNHPVGVIAAAFLFAVLQRGGVPVDAFTQRVSKDIV
jgi:simple sugar transport system permease protein